MKFLSNIKDIVLGLLSKLSKSIDEKQKFRFRISFLVTVIPTIALLFVGYYLHLIYEINLLYFDAYSAQASEEIREAFVAFMAEKSLGYIGIFGCFFLLHFFVGMHISALLLKPFERIGSYCNEFLEDNRKVYEPDLFSDFKLLTSFSEYFFRHIHSTLKKEKWDDQTIPLYYTRIHGPIFERVFFFHSCLMLGFLGTLSVVFIYFVSIDMNSNLIELAITTLKSYGPEEVFFLKGQNSFILSAITVSGSMVFVSYAVLAIVLYNKVSGAAFAYFATMRSFMKGKFSSRVHLIGYSYVRNYGRDLNRYLKFLETRLNEFENPEIGDSEKVKKLKRSV